MMTALKCPSHEKLRELSFGRLADEESDDLMSHVQTCPSCQTEMETVNDIEDSLIASIRESSAAADIYAESDCQLATINALGALAKAHSPQQDQENGQTELPKQIGEYEIVRPLGRGGMGSVYLAKHTKLGREVAIKVLAHHRLGDQRVRNRFEVEMQAIGRLSHPNIVTAHDARDIGGTLVLVTEFIDGFDLGQVLHRVGPLSIANATEIVRQVANAIDYTSRQGFVHRDIKPSNVMLGSDQVKLLDLGLARIELDNGNPDSSNRPEMTGTGQAMGTADYIAPEQVTDSRRVDVRADIYSLGCTLFKLLTATAPFDDDAHETAFAKMSAHVSSPPPSLRDKLPDAPNKLVRLVDSMLAKAPGDRPQSPANIAQQLTSFTSGHDLQQLLDDAKHTAPVMNTPVTVHNEPQIAPRKKFSIGALVGTGLLGILAGFALGVIVTINFPDGSKTVVRGGDGTEVSVEEDSRGSDTTTGPIDPTSKSTTGSNRNSDQNRTAEEILGLDQGDPTQATNNSGESMPGLDEAPDYLQPLMFVVLAEAPQNLASELPKANPTGAPIVTDNAIWFARGDDVEIPISELSGGGEYAAVLRDGQSVILWKDILGYISSNSMHRGSSRGNTTLTFRFHEKLASKMQQLTGENLNKRLGIVIHGKIVAAPRIASRISDRAEITGRFGSKTMRYLHDALDGGLMSAPAPELPKPATSSSSDPLKKSPLMFAIINEGRQPLPFVPKGPVEYEDSIYFPSDPKTNIDLQEFEDGKFYGAVKKDPNALITWDQIQWHMSVTMQAVSAEDDRTLQFSFDDELAETMKNLTEQHHFQHLAIIANGKIVAAPRINSTITNKALFTGRFTGTMMTDLMSAISLENLDKEP